MSSRPPRALTFHVQDLLGNITIDLSLEPRACIYPAPSKWQLTSVVASGNSPAASPFMLPVTLGLV